MLTCCCSNGSKVRGQRTFTSASESFFKEKALEIAAQIGISDFIASIFLVLLFDIHLSLKPIICVKNPSPIKETNFSWNYCPRQLKLRFKAKFLYLCRLPSCLITVSTVAGRRESRHQDRRIKTAAV